MLGGVSVAVSDTMPLVSDISSRTVSPILSPGTVSSGEVVSTSAVSAAPFLPQQMLEISTGAL